MPPKFEISNAYFTLTDGNGNIVMEGNMDNCKPKEFEPKGDKNNMEKFDIEKHWDDFMIGKIAVNCKTQKLANIFLEYCHSKNIKWYGLKEDLLPNSMWDTYKSETCYVGDKKGITYCNDRYISNIAEFIGFDLKLLPENNPLKTTTKEIIEVIYHDKETIVLIKADGRYYKGVVKCHYQDTYDKEEGFKRAYAIAREKYNEFKDYAKACADLVK